MKTSVLLSLPAVAVAQSLCDQYANYAANGYIFNNNEWGMASGTGSGCLNVDSTDANGVSWHVPWNWSGGDGQVKAYPYSGLDFTDRRFVSDIGSMPTSATWSYTGDGLNVDVAYDLFTAADPNHVTYSGDYELMIWLGKYGNIGPIGGTPVTTVTGLAGHDWDLYIGPNGAMTVYSFVAKDVPVTQFDGDVKDFYNYLAQNQNYPASSQYLLTYQFGTEPFTGSNAQFTVNHWSASIA